VSRRQINPERFASEPVPHPGTGDTRPSKSARKREMHARQDLGAVMMRLSAGQVARLGLDEELLAAVRFAQGLTAHEARRRQLQYIGKLMRSRDAEAIARSIQELQGGSRQSVAIMHASERLRDTLISDDAAVARFIDDHPGTDAQWLRSKVRAVRAEREAGRPPRNARELYQWVHERLQARMEAQGTSGGLDGDAQADADADPYADDGRDTQPGSADTAP
jgi:ribosome-associated protein